VSANSLGRLPRSFTRGLHLGSLRAGGASWLMAVADNPDLTRRRDHQQGDGDLRPGDFCNAIYPQSAISIEATDHQRSSSFSVDVGTCTVPA